MLIVQADQLVTRRRRQQLSTVLLLELLRGETGQALIARWHAGTPLAALAHEIQTSTNSLRFALKQVLGPRAYQGSLQTIRAQTLQRRQVRGHTTWGMPVPQPPQGLTLSPDKGGILRRLPDLSAAECEALQERAMALFGGPQPSAHERDGWETLDGSEGWEA